MYLHGMRSHRHGLIVLILFCTVCPATDWYVSPAGNDGAAGNQGAPWATIGKALSTSAGGDRILLQRGGTWRGTFTIDAGRVLDAYGSGNPPEITGSTVVSMTGNWSSNPNVRTGAVPSEALSLWVNGVFQPLARYPNSGFLNTTNDTTTTLGSITGSGLPARAAGRWNGAQVRWHRWHWFWETRAITADSGSTLTLANQALTPSGTTPLSETGLVGRPSGFFIDKDLDELDAPGEWFSSPTQVYVYPPSGVSGSSMTVEVATGSASVVVNGATIRNLAFRRFNADALSVNTTSTIEDCTFEHIGDTAISTSYNSAPVVIQRCIFRDILNCGVSVTQNPSSTGTRIERNLFHRIGIQRGYGGSGTWHHVAVLANVGAMDISLNRIVDTGYAGILLGNTPGNTANRNLIVRSMSTSNDGAGIYTYKGPNTMTENIVLDARGDQTAAEPFLPFGNGIWPEFLDGIANSQITDNTIAGCNGNGIALINNFTCNISRNVLYDNLTSGLLLDVLNDSATAQNHVLDDNVFATLASTRRLPVEGNLAGWYSPRPSAGIEFDNTNAVDFGLLRRSTFVTGSGTHLAHGSGGGNPVYASLSALASARPAWVENTGTVSTQHAVLLINDTESTANIAVPAGTWTTTTGGAVGSMVALNPFRSVVLVGASPAPTSPVYTVASGIDWRQSTPATQPLYATPEIDVTRGATPVVNGGTDAVTGTVSGTAKPLSYQIANLSTVALTLSTPVTLTPSGCTLSGISQPATTVTTATTLAFTVTPTAAGAWSVTVSIGTNDPDETPCNWTVSGTASATPQPEIEMRTVPDDTTIANAGTQPVSGSAATVATVVSYDILNAGSADLTIGTPMVDSQSGCQALLTTTPATTIPAGQRRRLTVTVTPNAPGAWSCRVTCTTNDANENPTSWTVSGTAGPAPVSGGGTASSGAGGGGAAALAAWRPCCVLAPSPWDCVAAAEPGIRRQ